MTQAEAIIQAFQELGGERSIKEIEDWVRATHGNQWKDFSTLMADMVSISTGGNLSSCIPDFFRVLQRVNRGTYRLIDEVSGVSRLRGRESLV